MWTMATFVCRALTPDDTAREYYLERVIRFYNAASDNPFDTPDESLIAEEARMRVEKAGQRCLDFLPRAGLAFL